MRFVVSPGGTRIYGANPMKYTRRGFLEAAGAIVTAAGVGCSRRPQTADRVSGATGVELSVENAALPDYSHDLEQYLVRLASEARVRRKQAIDAISTMPARTPGL